MNMFAPFKSLSVALGVYSIPQDSLYSEGWKCTVSGCEIVSHVIVNQCPKDAFLVAPNIIHASHIFLNEGKVVYKLGNMSMDRPSPFYIHPSIPCYLIKDKSIVTWEVKTHTSFFARIPYWPRVEKKEPWQNTFYEVAQPSASVVLISIALFVALCYGLRSRLVSSFFFAAISSSIYFAMSTAKMIVFPVSNLSTHKIADIFIWISVIYVFVIFKIRGIIGSFVFLVSVFHIIIGIVIILLSGTGDFVQLGSMFPFSVCFLSLSYVFIKSIFALIKDRNRRRWLELVSITLFCFSGFNEMLVVLGISTTIPTFLQIGVVGLLVFVAVVINEETIAFIAERERLKQQVNIGNLALKVSTLQTKLAMAKANVEEKASQIDKLLNK